MQPELSRLEPIFQPRIWGAHSLAPLYGDKTDLREAVGEAWLTGAGCRFASGPFAGKTLGEAWRRVPDDWRGANLAGDPDFPLLIKFLFPNDKLSIQVHPDDAYASAHERAAGGRGKTEMWHVLSAESGAWVLLGLKPEVTREQVLAALAPHTLEHLFENLPVAARDTFFIPATMPHAIGPGMVLCEVQQYSDITYRVYDYGRVDAAGQPRPLHVEKALAVMRFGKSRGGRTSPLRLPVAAAPQAQRALLAACSFFATERWSTTQLCELPRDPAQLELLVVLSGEGTFHSGGASEPFHAAECWLAPASLKALSVHPAGKAVFLRVYVPNLALLSDELTAAGHSRAAQAGVLFP